MLAVVAPGQGAQTPGFLAPWLDVPGVEDQLQWLSSVAEIDLVAHGTTSDAATIKDTAVAQPLLVGAGLASFSALFAPDGIAGHHAIVTGHSVGEITAAAAAGMMSDEQAMLFVRERGRAMAAASAVEATGMSAVLGGVEAAVLEALAVHDLTPANINGAGQIVAAGTLDALASLAQAPPAKARVMPLQVAGAFHTEHMQPAVAVLRRHALAMTVRDPHIALVCNADGMVVRDGREVLDRLVRQVSRPVRWDLCMRTLLEHGVTGLIELPPAGTLIGLAKRGMRGVESFGLKTPDDLDSAREFIARHSSIARHASEARPEMSPQEVSQ